MFDKYKKYDSNEDRLAAIMRNVVRNNGTFVPFSKQARGGK